MEQQNQQARIKAEQANAAAVEQYKRELLEQARRGGAQTAYTQPVNTVHTTAYASQAPQTRPAQQKEALGQRLEQGAVRTVERAEPFVDLAMRSGLASAGLAAAAKGIELGIEAVGDHYERRREERREERREAAKPAAPTRQPTTIINNNIDMEPSVNFRSSYAPETVVSPRVTDAPRIEVSPRVTDTVSPKVSASPKVRVEDGGAQKAAPVRQPAQQKPKPLPAPVAPQPARPQPVYQRPIPIPQPLTPPAPSVPRPTPVARPVEIRQEYCESTPAYRPVEEAVYYEPDRSCYQRQRPCPVHGYRNIPKRRCPSPACICGYPGAVMPAVPLSPAAPAVPVSPVPITPTVPPKQPRAVEYSEDAWFLQAAVGGAPEYAPLPAAAEAPAPQTAEYAYSATETVAADEPSALDGSLTKVAYDDNDDTPNELYYAPQMAEDRGTWELPSPKFSSLDDFLSKNSGHGTVTVHVLTSDFGVPVQNANVRVLKKIGGTQYLFYDVDTSADGTTGPLTLPTPEKQYSYTPPQGFLPYATYDIHVTYDENIYQEMENATVFADTESVQVVRIGKARDTRLDEAQYSA
ncbi:MAG: hypothetical protein LBG83_08870 [Oscillospiraceae bacterium]|jgi:hypothetical protein|nr:hypothetical protein [Oscillospiraceae bacterium]